MVSGLENKMNYQSINEVKFVSFTGTIPSDMLWPKYFTVDADVPIQYIKEYVKPLHRISLKKETSMVRTLLKVTTLRYLEEQSWLQGELQVNGRAYS